MRVETMMLGVVLASCSACPQPVMGLGAPKVVDRAQGLPKPMRETAAGLLDETQVRRCQVLFEPAFSSAHAVWLVQGDPAADATVFVRIRTAGDDQSYSAPLDRNTALRLSELCLASVSSRSETCPRHGVDGVWYHAAHPDSSHSYAMASFWSPRRGTVASAFVKVAEALRNYATSSATLRSPAWLALREASDGLSEHLASAE